MRSLWSDGDAEAMVARYGAAGVERDLALRVYTSRLLGGDPHLVLVRGGLAVRRPQGASSTLVLETPYGFVRVPAQGTRGRIKIDGQRALVEYRGGGSQRGEVAGALSVRSHRDANTRSCQAKPVY